MALDYSFLDDEEETTGGLDYSFLEQDEEEVEVLAQPELMPEQTEPKQIPTAAGDFTSELGGSLNQDSSLVERNAKNRQYQAEKSPPLMNMAAEGLVGMVSPALNHMAGVDSDDPMSAQNLASEVFNPDNVSRPHLRPAGETDDKDFFDAVKETTYQPERLIPFVGQGSEMGDIKDLYQAAKRIEGGESSDKDQKLIQDWLNRAKEDSERGSTLGYKVVNLLSHLPGFVGEFALTGGTYTAGKNTASKGIIKLLKESVEESTKKGLIRQGAEATLGAAYQTIPAMGMRIAGNTMDRMLEQYNFSTDDKGKMQAVMEEGGDSFNIAMTKAFGDSYIEILSERSGGAIPLVWAKLPGVKKITGLKAAVIGKWLKAKPNKTIDDLLKTIREKGGWHGVFGEMMEERIGEAARYATGVEDEYSPYEMYKREELGEQLLSEAIAFSVPGAGAAILRRTTERGPDTDQGDTPPELFNPTHRAGGGQDVQIVTKNGKIVPDTFINAEGDVFRDSNAVPVVDNADDVSMDVNATAGAIKAEILGSEKSDKVEPVTSGTGEAIDERMESTLQMRERGAQQRPEKLQGVSRGEHAEDAPEIRPDDAGAANEVELQGLRKPVLNEGATDTGALREVRGEEITDASRGLQQATAGKLVVPSLSPKAAPEARAEAIGGFDSKASLEADRRLTGAHGRTEERRTDIDHRRELGEMSIEDKHAEIEKLRVERITDPMTGMGNRTGYNEAEKLPVQVSVDADSLKWINDNIGQIEGGDAMLKAIGVAISKESDNSFHISGDEFFIQTSTKEEADATMAKINARLEPAEITVMRPDGVEISKKGLRVTYGLGSTESEANYELKKQKQAKEKRGERAGQGKQPGGVAVFATEREQDSVGQVSRGQPITVDRKAAYPEGKGEAAAVTTKKKYHKTVDPRFGEFEGALNDLDSQLVEGGGIALIPDPNFKAGESDKPGETPLIRTKSQNPSWFQSLASEEKVTVAQVHNAIDAAKAGKFLGKKQSRIITAMIDQVEHTESLEKEHANKTPQGDMFGKNETAQDIKNKIEAKKKQERNAPEMHEGKGDLFSDKAQQTDITDKAELIAKKKAKKKTSKKYTGREQYEAIVDGMSNADILIAAKELGVKRRNTTADQARVEIRAMPADETLNKINEMNFPAAENAEERFDEEEDWDNKVENFPVPDKTVNAEKEAGKEYIPKDEADAILKTWKAEAKRISETEDHSNEVIFSFFDESGEISKPWREAGYDVYQYDMKLGDDIMSNFPTADFLDIEATGKKVIGIIAQPPCTCFSSSGARWWSKRHDVHDRNMVNKMFGSKASVYFSKPKEYTKMLVSMLDLAVEFTAPSNFILMENPVGRIATEMGLPKPTMTFNPNVYGDPYTKKTQLWGKFNTDLPTANVEPTQGSLMHKMWSTAEKSGGSRSLTPEGFAYSFFMANNTSEANTGIKPAAIYKADEKLYRIMDGKDISYEAEIMDTGETFTVTVDAGGVMRQLDAREKALEKLKDCI